jgi:hypothetical protein
MMAFVHSRITVIIRSDDGTQEFKAKAGDLISVPEWATKTRYYDLLVKAGKFSVAKSTADKDLQAAVEEPEPEVESTPEPIPEEEAPVEVAPEPILEVPVVEEPVAEEPVAEEPTPEPEVAEEAPKKKTSKKK